MLNLRKDGDGVLLPVRVIPGASSTRLMGLWEGYARIAVSAPPEKGKANQALVEFVARCCGVRRGQVTVTAGFTSALKTIRIEGASIDAVRTALGPDRS